ncbi:hypothetical protein GMD78_12530 [Ornithinibacillus sp. L9]|uniref:Uncharacterized protein n=1 Tax=Ornithinibacillus caprae TaxID=2678566 RepID=A0A6N8FHX9_9BACI|nr:hypothetical protein [Ornithinibacillus caprae]MUK89200.1 hypothetical protein [Ornithinibacillus caprae]
MGCSLGLGYSFYFIIGIGFGERCRLSGGDIGVQRRISALKQKYWRSEKNIGSQAEVSAFREEYRLSSRSIGHQRRKSAFKQKYLSSDENTGHQAKTSAILIGLNSNIW